MHAEPQYRRSSSNRPTGLTQDGQTATPAMSAQLQLGEMLNRSAAVQSQLQMRSTLNSRPAVVAQARLVKAPDRAATNSPTVSAAIQRQLHGSFNVASYAGANATANPFNALVALGLPITPSGLLRLGLRYAGVPDSNTNLASTGNQAHHIVERNDANAAPARAWLARAGVELDSAVNGVFLPVTHGDDTGDATVHFGSHHAAYANMVNTAIDTAIDQDPVLAGAGITSLTGPAAVTTVPEQTQLRAVIIATLNRLRNFLLNNPIQINKGYRVDEDYDPNDMDRDKPDTKRGGFGSGKSIATSFQESY
jgi:hypothetical protein